MNKTKLLAAVCCTAILFAACEKSEPKVANNNDTKEAVDLGLSVKWATCNLGATKPEEYGNYYAWGEITTKASYTWANYKYANEDYEALTKYCSKSNYGKDGFTDTLTTLAASDDAAIQNWGGNWRMPTNNEWEELIEKCIWTWTTKNGVNGYEVKATNGNSIFLPAAGARANDELYYTGLDGFYWSSLLNTVVPYNAQNVCLKSDSYNTYGYDRSFGRSVRPVLGK